MSYKPGVIIRNIKSGLPLRVIRSYPGGTIVVDPQNPANPTPTFVLQEREYDQWVDEKKLQIKEKKRNEWYDEPVILWKIAVVL